MPHLMCCESLSKLSNDENTWMTRIRTRPALGPEFVCSLWESQSVNQGNITHPDWYYGMLLMENLTNASVVELKRECLFGFVKQCAMPVRQDDDHGDDNNAALCAAESGFDTLVYNVVLMTVGFCSMIFALIAFGTLFITLIAVAGTVICSIITHFYNLSCGIHKEESDSQLISVTTEE